MSKHVDPILGPGFLVGGLVGVAVLQVVRALGFDTTAAAGGGVPGTEAAVRAGCERRWPKAAPGPLVPWSPLSHSSVGHPPHDYGVPQAGFLPRCPAQVPRHLCRL